MSNGPRAKERRGRVVQAHGKSISQLESIARQRDAKGCFLDRGQHRQERAIAQWLRGIREADFDAGELSRAELQVAPERGECNSACDELHCPSGELGPAVDSAADDIRDACAHLVSVLPSSFRDDIRRDAEDLATLQRNLCPDVPWLRFSLEIAQYDACVRWHQDAHVGRALICYRGPGTYTADDTVVRWDEFTKTMYQESNEVCVARKDIKQMESNTVLLMKGDSWPGICGSGLTHRAPDVRSSNPTKRLLLKVDLDYSHLQSESEEEGIEEEEEEEEEKEEYAETQDPTTNSDDSQQGSMILKRLASSEGWESAQAWKVIRRKR